MAYTQAQIDELKAVEGLDFEKAKVFGAKHGISPRSVVAKAKALGLDYKVKTKGGATATTTKAKETVRRKSEVATSITELLDVTLKSLDKMTSEDLTTLEERVKEMVGA